VRIVVVGNSANTGALTRELDAADLTVERWREDPPPGGGPEEIAALACQLREFERALDREGPDAVVLASDSSAALAAVLVATKLGTPVGWIEVPAEDAAGANANLIHHLADAALAPDAAAIASWLRGTYTARG